MNKEEAKQKLHNLAFAKLNTKPDDLKLADVMQIVNQIDEPQKPVVPQCVAEWIEYFKNCKGTLYGSTNPFSYYGRAIIEDFEGDYEEALRWIRDNSDTYARAWLDGYEVEKEKKCTVRIKATKQYLCNDETGPYFSSSFRSDFTRTNLEELGFGWVFSCEGVEVQEV